MFAARRRRGGRPRDPRALARSGHEHRAEADAVGHDLPESLLGLLQRELLDRGRTPVRALNATVSSESIALPLGQPAMVLPERSESAGIWSGSKAAATMSSLPRALSPFTVLAMAALWRGRQHQVGPAEPSQPLGRVHLLRVDVLMRGTRARALPSSIRARGRRCEIPSAPHTGWQGGPGRRCLARRPCRRASPRCCAASCRW